ncbi:MAG: porin [Litoreibacter sp.]|nr:porin [Litoreibacter sp.]
MTLNWTKTLALSALGATALALPLSAMDFSGGYLTGAHAEFTDRDTIRKSGVTAGAEYRLNDRYNLQIDANTFRFNEADTGSYNLAVHGIRHLNETFSVGAFVGTERVSNQSAGYYGTEAALGSGPLTVETYAAKFVEGDDRDAATFGISASASITERIDLGLDYGRFEITGTRDVSRVSAKASYQLSNRASLNAEYGRVELGSPFGNLDDNFVSLGVTIHFGDTGRTTFGQRGLSTLLPGG